MTLIKRKRSASTVSRKRARVASRRSRLMRKSRVVRKLDMIPHNFIRVCSDSNWNSVNTSSTASFTNGVIKNSLIGSSELSFSYGFQMADLPNFAEFGNLYDQYRLNYVVLTIKLVSNPFGAYPLNGTSTSSTINGANWFPTLWMVRDHDDNTTISLDAIKQYSTVKHRVLMPNREIKLTVKPSTVATLYQGTTVVPGTVQYKKWTDVGYPNITHYGAKFVVDFEGQTTTAANQWAIKVDAKYYFQMKVSR